jgi:hypothetical protein
MHLATSGASVAVKHSAVNRPRKVENLIVYVYIEIFFDVH